MCGGVGGGVGSVCVRCRAGVCRRGRAGDERGVLPESEGAVL